LIEKSKKKEMGTKKKNEIYTRDTWTSYYACRRGMKVQRQNTFRLPSHHCTHCEFEKKKIIEESTRGKWRTLSGLTWTGRERIKKDVLIKLLRRKTGQGRSSPPCKGHDNARFKLAEKHPVSDGTTTGDDANNK
jgi:hypothetical protein